MLEEGSVSSLLQRSSNFTKALSQEVEIQLIGWTLGTRADLRRGEALWNHHTITYLFCTTIILDNRVNLIFALFGPTYLELVAWIGFLSTYMQI